MMIRDGVAADRRPRRRRAQPQRVRSLKARRDCVRNLLGRLRQPCRPAHPADHRRRHRRLQVARPDPPPARARRGGALCHDRGRAGIRHAAVGRRAVRRPCLHRPVRPPGRARYRPHPTVARGRPDRRRAGDRRPDGEARKRPCQRPRLDRAPGDRQAGADGAGDEPENVEPQGDAPQPGDACEGRHRLRRAQRAARWPKAARPAPAAWPSRWRSSPRSRRCSTAAPKPLAGRRIIVTSGPTHEPIDPVRYIANRSSGKQGHAIAAALARLGADVRLVSGPGLDRRSGRRDDRPCRAARRKCATPSSSFCRPTPRSSSPRSRTGARRHRAPARRSRSRRASGPPSLQMVENPDILAGIGHHRQRPYLVIGFAAETREPACQRPGQARDEGRRLHRRQRCQPRRRRHGRRPQPRQDRLQGRRRGMARNGKGRRLPRGSPSWSPSG